MVPTPRAVKISSSRAWGTRPSRMTAASTPLSSASTQVCELGDHAAANGAILHQRIDLADGEIGEQVSIAVEHARHVGQHQQAGCLQRAGDGARGRIGVDVVGLACPAKADGRDDGNESRRGQAVQHIGIDLRRIADESQIDRLAALDHLHAVGGHQAGILAAEAQRIAARLGHRLDDLLVDLAGQHHLDDFDGGTVGDAQPVDEAALDLQTIQHLGDLRTAAMHHHRIDAHLLDQHDVAGEDAGELVIDHGMTTIFDDEGLARIALHIGQRLGQGARRAQPILGFGEIRDLGHGRGLYRKGWGRERLASSARSSGMPLPSKALVAMISGCAARWRATPAATSFCRLASAPALS